MRFFSPQIFLDVDVGVDGDDDDDHDPKLFLPAPDFRLEFLLELLVLVDFFGGSFRVS